MPKNRSITERANFVQAQLNAAGGTNPQAFAALAEVVGDLGNDLNEVIKISAENNQTTKENTAQLNARLLELEQAAVGAKSRRVASHGTAHDVSGEVIRSLGESPAFASLKDWNHGTVRAKVGASIRAIVTEGRGDSGASTMPSNPERSGIVGPALSPLTLIQVLPSRPTASDAVEHVRLNVTGDAAQQVKEGDEKAELDFEGELVRAGIITVAGHTTASKQVLADNSALQSQVDLVIRSKVTSKLEDHILNGQGGDDVEGLLHLATVMVPSITSTPADRIGETVTAMRDRGYNPNVVVMNSWDWLKLGITKDADGNYQFGSPLSPAGMTLWNSPVVTSSKMAQGQVLVLDTAYITSLDREAANVMVSNSHKDYFTRNLVLILGELRAGLEVLDGQAIYLVDLEP
ncbi:phage major capsid protein, HK97 family [compost metagenome]